MRSQKGKVSSAVVFIVVAVVLASALGGVGYWYGKKGSKKAEQKTTTSSAQDVVADASKPTTNTPPPATKSESATVCASSTSPATFYSKLIGLEFCYPKEWGEATVGNVPASASAVGSAYEITFSKNSKVTVASATSDYVNTIGRGGRCADPVTKMPDFSSYSSSWKINGDMGVDQYALRYTIKKDDVYIVQESASDFGGNVCLTGYAYVSGGAYTVITVNMQASFGSGITTVKAHTDNPTILLTPADRVQFGELVESIKNAS